jgi:hypothetical protein
MRIAPEMPENQQIPEPGAAKASVTLSTPIIADDDLRAIVEAWPDIPPAMRAGILAMVRTTVKTDS